MNRNRIATVFFLAVSVAGRIDAQRGAPAIVAGYELDTTFAMMPNADTTSLKAVWSLWRDYLAARIGGHERPDLWHEGERAKWPEYDLTAFQAFQSFVRASVTVLSIRPPHPGTRDTLLIRTLISRLATDSLRGSEAVRPIALTRVYAVRTPAGWRLSNAFDHFTSGWRRVRHGSITFLYSPDSHADPTRGKSAARFVDSLARVFQLPPPRDLLYVVTPTAEEAYRVMGFDYAITGSVTAGKTFVSNGLLFAGDARLGEAYFHELAHIVFASIAPADSIPFLVNEGLAIWAGGTLGQSYSQVRAAFLQFLQNHPETTLDSVVDGLAKGDVRPAGALLCEMLFESGGASAIKVFVSELRKTNFRRAVELASGKPWAEFSTAWLARARRGAA